MTKVYLGAKYWELQSHPSSSPRAYLAPYYPAQVIDGPYDSFEGVKDFDSEGKGEEQWAVKWLVRYNDGRVELLSEDYFERWMQEAKVVAPMDV